MKVQINKIKFNYEDDDISGVTVSYRAKQDDDPLRHRGNGDVQFTLEEYLQRPTPEQLVDFIINEVVEEWEEAIPEDEEGK